jgi:hypothetical protein
MMKRPRADRASGFTALPLFGVLLGLYAWGGKPSRADESGEDFHARVNPVYRELRQSGVATGEKAWAPLPPPLLADGGRADQRAALAAIPGRRHPVEELLRKSTVAPFEYRLQKIDRSDPEAPTYGLDVWFVAYGDLKAITKETLIFQLGSASQKSTKVKILGKEDLTKRGVGVKSRPGVEECYLHLSYPLFNRVQMRMTNHAVVSYGPDSILVATRPAPAFTDDPEFPNQWRSMKKDDEGQLRLGPARRYEGNGVYLKITRLAEPEGALVVELHQVFTEPKGWFDGSNLLRSKLPLALLLEVRGLRAKLLKKTKATR